MPGVSYHDGKSSYFPHPVVAKVIAVIRRDTVSGYFSISPLQIDPFGRQGGIQFNFITVLYDLTLGKVHQCPSEAFVLIGGQHEQPAYFIVFHSHSTRGTAVLIQQKDAPVFEILHDMAVTVVGLEKLHRAPGIVMRINLINGKLRNMPYRFKIPRTSFFTIRIRLTLRKIMSGCRTNPRLLYYTEAACTMPEGCCSADKHSPCRREPGKAEFEQ